jgi:hypothetical protein
MVFFIQIFISASERLFLPTPLKVAIIHSWNLIWEGKLAISLHGVFEGICWKILDLMEDYLFV